MHRKPRLRHPDDERGASLILALGFLFAVGIVIAAVATLATNAFQTTNNLGQQRTLEANAESAATVAIENVRYNNIAPATMTNCMPGGTAYQGMTTFCAYTNPPNPFSPESRVIEFCTTSGSSCAAGNPIYVSAVVRFDDLPPNSEGTADNCGSGTPTTCGIAMTVDSWDVRTADN
jgi:hypothetical protein